MFESLRWLLPNLVEPTMLDGLIAVVIIGVTLIIQRYMLPKIIHLNVTFLERKKELFFARVIEQFEMAMRNALVVTAIFIALSIFFGTSLFSANKTGTFFISVIVYYVFKGIYDVLAYYTSYPEKFSLVAKEQNILTPFFLRIMKVIVMVIALFTIAAMWDFNLNGFLTGIGLTGVAMAFGIRETLGHIFGGMSIALDKPFQIGDWVATEDQKIEGVIEDINLRSTLIQTGDKGLVYVPNAHLVNRPIFNYSKRMKRKCEFYTYVSADNSEGALRHVCEQIRGQVALHVKTEKDIIHVAIDEMRPHSYRMLVRFFVATNDTAEMLEVKQDILFAMRQIFDDANVTLATEEHESRWVYSEK